MKRLKVKIKPKPKAATKPPVHAERLKLRRIFDDEAPITKKAISIRLDEEIIDWFKAHNPTGYQSAINKVLLDHVRRDG